jgi:hypothetical protein
MNITKSYVLRSDMGRACSTNGGDEECIQNIGGKARRKETKEDQDVGGWTILK